MKERDKKALMAAAAMGGVFALRAAVRQRRTIDLQGRTVLITGGSRGLGLILARLFADEGAKVAICARDVAELQRARADLVERGAPVLAVRCDVTNRGQVEAMVR